MFDKNVLDPYKAEIENFRVSIFMYSNERLCNIYLECVARYDTINGIKAGVLEEEKNRNSDYFYFEERKFLDRKMAICLKEFKKRKITPYEKYSLRWFMFKFLGYW